MTKKGTNTIGRPELERTHVLIAPATKPYKGRTKRFTVYAKAEAARDCIERSLKKEFGRP